MTELQKKLILLGDAPNADFQAKLIPTLPRERFLGVRMPALRRFARTFAAEAACEDFLRALPHRYYDEDMLHAVLLSREGNFAAVLAAVDAFLPYVDNWAVCDALRPHGFARHPEALLPEVRRWIADPAVYTCRFGMGMLMTHFLDADFTPALLELPLAVKSEDYYVRMMAAWYYATALAKQWDAAVPYIERRRLPEWIHRKTIQKAVESFRITPAQKEYLKEFR